MVVTTRKSEYSHEQLLIQKRVSDCVCAFENETAPPKSTPKSLVQQSLMATCTKILTLGCGLPATQATRTHFRAH